MGPGKSREDYLRAIYHFVEEEGNNKVRSTDVSDYLGISKPSVAEMTSSLIKKGLIRKERYSAIFLTKRGMLEAKRITQKHRLIEVFLINFLKIDKKDLHKEAHRLEHAFSEKVINKLKALLNNPSVCPHGKPIGAESIIKRK